MRILYVEDDLRDAEVTVRILHKNAPHLHLETVSTIREALARLERIASDPVDLVLLDVHLRDGDGLTLLSQIRENALPVAAVVITGMGDEETAVAALKTRADDYVTKRSGYLDRLPLVLESAFNHYRADAARRAHQLKVLFVEFGQNDIESMRRHFAIYADHIHLDVVRCAADAVSALQRKDQPTPYDVVLLDHHLPELNALDLLKELRQTHRLDVPAVVLCSQGDEEFAGQSLTLGASSFVVKNPGLLHQLPWELEQAESRAQLLRREEELEESQRRYELATAAAGVGVWDWNLATGDIYIDPVLKSILGYTDQEIHNQIDEWSKLVHPDDVASMMQRAQAHGRGETPLYELENRMLHKDGSIRWFLTRGNAVRDANGSAVRIVGTNSDITERKVAEQSLQNALEEVERLKDQLHAENIYLQEEIRVAHDFGEIIGGTEALKRVLRLTERVAPLDTTVLILGETGTGKELLAHAIHKLSARCNRPLVKVNCATLPAQLIESELFGHERGAFTGAAARRTGRFEIANGGTLFLDEIGDLPLDLQTRLLRVLQEGEFELVGSSRTVKVDVRVIAATNRDLEGAVREGLFRSDLYYRLSIFPITLPPLRERLDDIPILVSHFVKQLSLKLGKEIQAIPQETMAALQKYPWPGNIREMRNVIERAVIITQGPKLRLLDSLESATLSDADLERLPQTQTERRAPEGNRGETLDEIQHDLIISILEKTYWRIEGQDGAAALLKIHPNTLRSRMKRLGITKPKFKSQGR